MSDTNHMEAKEMKRSTEIQEVVLQVTARGIVATAYSLVGEVSTAILPSYETLAEAEAHVRRLYPVRGLLVSVV